jgi:hypothetical protein
MIDIAQGKVVKATSQESDGLKGDNITDGDDNSRWSSAHDDDEAMATIDLGEVTELYGSEIKWENSFAAKYLMEISSDGAKWTPLGGERAGFAGLQKLDFAGEKARYVRMHGLEKATQYGYSIFSWRIFGKLKSYGASAPLGLAVESAKPVLKEGVECPLTAKAWYGGDKFKVVDVEWTSADGTFTATGFTPTTNGFAAVTASAGGLSVTKRLPVEEALAVSTLTFATTNMVAIAGEPVKLELSATDQFGGKMALKGVKMEVVAPGGKKAVAGKDFKAQKGGWIVPLKSGEFRVKAKLGGVEAVCVIATSGLKDVNLARLATVTSSGEENAGLTAERAADGDMKTRWGSRHRDGEWICFDFGRERTISSCAIDWENARAESYVIEVSTDGAKWQPVADVTSNEGGHQVHEFRPVKARKLRITGRKRNTSYGISIFEADIR